MIENIIRLFQSFKITKTINLQAAINGSIEILTLLLVSNKVKARALINENDNKGLNVLHYVVRNENASNILRILLNSDSLEINHEDKVGKKNFYT